MAMRMLPVVLVLLSAASCCGGPTTRTDEVAEDLQIEREVRIQFREIAVTPSPALRVVYPTVDPVAECRCVGARP